MQRSRAGRGWVFLGQKRGQSGPKSKGKRDSGVREGCHETPLVAEQVGVGLSL